MDERVPFAELQDVFGAEAVVTRPHPDNTPIETTVVWEPPRENVEPGGMSVNRLDSIRVLCLAKADVPTLPLDSIIVVAEFPGATVARWRVADYDRDDDEMWGVRVVRAPRSRIDS